MSSLHFSSLAAINYLRLTSFMNSVHTGLLCGRFIQTALPLSVLHPKGQCFLTGMAPYCGPKDSLLENWKWKKSGHLFRKIQRWHSGFHPGVQESQDSHQSMTSQSRKRGSLAPPVPFISTLKTALLRLGLTLPQFPLAFQVLLPLSFFIFLLPFQIQSNSSTNPNSVSSRVSSIILLLEAFSFLIYNRGNIQQQSCSENQICDI